MPEYRIPRMVKMIRETTRKGHGRPEDVLRVLVDVLLGDAGVEHDDVGHGGALIAEVRAADDRARGKSIQQVGDAVQGNRSFCPNPLHPE